MLVLLLFTLPLLRDAIYDFVGIYGGLLVETPSNFLDMHVLLGFILIIFGLAHIGLHINNTKSELIMREPVKDFKVFHSHGLSYSHSNKPVGTRSALSLIYYGRAG